MDWLLWMAYLRSLALATEVTQEIFAIQICLHSEWYSKDTFFRESHVRMLTQREVFLQAGVQV